jgi:hypothetical protein
MAVWIGHAEKDSLVITGCIQELSPFIDLLFFKGKPFIVFSGGYSRASLCGFRFAAAQGAWKRVEFSRIKSLGQSV